LQQIDNLLYLLARYFMRMFLNEVRDLLYLQII
jgi:hypothetical protein